MLDCWRVRLVHHCYRVRPLSFAFPSNYPDERCIFASEEKNETVEETRERDPTKRRRNWKRLPDRVSECPTRDIRTDAPNTRSTCLSAESNVRSLLCPPLTFQHWRRPSYASRVHLLNSDAFESVLSSTRSSSDEWRFSTRLPLQVLTHRHIIHQWEQARGMVVRPSKYGIVRWFVAISLDC